MKKFISITALFLGILYSLAQVPQKMSYQAIIRNASGQLIQNQNVSVKASLLIGSETGIVAYSERLAGTTNANGLLSLEIGSGTVLSGNFLAINWSAGNFYLKTETDPTGGTNYTIAGTSQLLSVPYAMYANSAGNSSNGFSLPYSGSNSTTTTSLSISNDSGSGTAINGFGAGTGNGVSGLTSGGKGIYGSANSGNGIEGYSNSGTAGYFSSNSGLALKTGTGGTEINGNLKITSGNPGAGRTLVSDATGNASWKNLPVGFTNSKETSQTISSGGSYTKVTFSSTNGSQQGTAYSFPNSEFTAPANGFYHIESSLFFKDDVYTPTTGNIYVAICVNGNAKYSKVFYRNGTTNDTHTVSSLLRLNANDVVDIRVLNQTTSQIQVSANNAVSYSYFSGYQVF